MTAPLKPEPHRISWVGVVVPAHNEQELLPGCLAGLRAAIAAVTVPVNVIVVLDACSDGSELAAGALPSISINARNVGRARRVGFAHLLSERPPGIPDSRSWLATTDADSIVPPDWLARMLAHAAAGWTGIAGTVRVTDWSEHHPGVRPRWQGQYQPGDRHPQVHGANLGVRADAYRQVGGMPSLALAEDVELVAALEAAGERVIRAGDLPVVTSGRRIGRAPGGFAAHLRDLAS